MGAVGLNVTDTFYAKISPIYLNIENLLSDEICDDGDEQELLLLRALSV